MVPSRVYRVDQRSLGGGGTLTVGQPVEDHLVDWHTVSWQDIHGTNLPEQSTVREVPGRQEFIECRILQVFFIATLTYLIL